MLRRSSLTVFALAVAALVIGGLRWQSVSQARPDAIGTVVGGVVGAGHGKCIGMKAVVLPGSDVKVYRVFEDGTVERAIDQGHNAFVSWVVVK
jgi:hypothetical protein